MDHHDRHAVAALRHHVAHVHLVDGDVSSRTKVAQLGLRLFDLVAADEEAALGFQDEGLVRSLYILEALGHHVARGAQDRRHGEAGHKRRIEDRKMLVLSPRAMSV